MGHIRAIAELARDEYGIRAVVHPHAGGYIEFADETLRLLADIPYEVADLCLDTGHLYYSKMDPVEWIREHQDRIDYLHFKDIEPSVYTEVMQHPIDFFAACAQGVMCPIGQGVVDLCEVMLPELKISRLMCSRQSFVKSRAPLEDNAYVVMEYEGGAIGTLWASAVNAGSMHGQKIRVIGSKASLEWWDEQPNQLRYEVQGRPVQVLERGMDYLHPDALEDDRIGGGHPEGLFEAWSNLYYRFALAMEAMDKGDKTIARTLGIPDIDAGCEGVRWVENGVRSAELGAAWIDYA
nr:Gfo/Idh/MocA family oxidoreductase [Marinobacterium sedimentorum]